MALCMYNYIKEEAGSSLYLLFSALKHQIEKGPVDAITHDARYSLSEERLLREPVEYSTVIIQVVQEGQLERTQCRVIDCDTITQVKNKILDTIYKNVPISQRPAAAEVDLEWRHGRGGHLILADEDLTTKTVNGWKRVNTLSHYGIKDAAVMSLVVKNHRNSNAHLYETIPNANSPLPSPVRQNVGGGIYSHYYSTIQPTTRICDEGVRYWHLVRPADEHQGSPKGHHPSPKAIPEIFLTRLLSTKVFFLHY